MLTKHLGRDTSYGWLGSQGIALDWLFHLTQGHNADYSNIPCYLLILVLWVRIRVSGSLSFPPVLPAH